MIEGLDAGAERPGRAPRPANYEGVRDLVGQAVEAGRRPAVWSPGGHLVIDWGVVAGVHV